jgi:hypothetical protein
MPASRSRTSYVSTYSSRKQAEGSLSANVKAPDIVPPSTKSGQQPTLGPPRVDLLAHKGDRLNYFPYSIFH